MREQSQNPGRLCHKALGGSLCLFIFLYLTVLPALPMETGKALLLPAMLLLTVFIVLEASLRFGGRPARIRPMLRQRLSGCAALAALVGAYFCCALLNLSYSPLKAQIFAGWLIPMGGAVIWLGILFYAGSADEVDNLIICTAASGMAGAAYALAGFPIADSRSMIRTVAAGLYTGAVFFLSAQYNRVFKAVVGTAAAGLMVPAVWRCAQWGALAAPAAALPRGDIMRSAVGQLEGYLTPEILLGRGSGYDLSFTAGQGVQNFLLADLLNGGVVRFALGLAVWLCASYFVFMLFLERRGVSMIYLGVLGMAFTRAFFAGHESFLLDPLFWPFCALLAAEHTMIKTGRRRFPGA